ncbi:alpha/beta hydrolase [Amycolatopsis sp. NBC_00345]|uniref:alpha/beta fold hydrolase n=1 Tax=Amycolatopsis sp. NBC_00345 TaxID=2975955 RepID=UPI002E259CCC
MTSRIDYGAVETVPGTDITFRRTGRGRRSVLFVHGYLDGYTIWDDLITSLKTSDVEFVVLDLAGMGDRADAEGPLTLDRYADEVGQVADLLAKPTVLVGHSIGAPIVELVAAQRPGILGLVLIASIPLAGTHLPAAALEPFSRAAGDVEAMRALLLGATAGSREEGLDHMAAVAAKVRPDAVEAIAQAWNNGHPDGNAPSEYRGPVLLLPGTEDDVASIDSVKNQVAPRFAEPRYFAVENAGHYPHFEQYHVVAEQIDKFLAEILAPGSQWLVILSRPTLESFSAACTPDVTLRLSAAEEPVVGPAAVRHFFTITQTMYDSLAFVHEARDANRTYMKWEGQFQNKPVSGVTILSYNESGLIREIELYHRPYGQVLAFAAELTRRLAKP